jgi:hypothetical protein
MLNKQKYIWYPPPDEACTQQPQDAGVVVRFPHYIPLFKFIESNFIRNVPDEFWSTGSLDLQQYLFFLFPFCSITLFSFHSFCLYVSFPLSFTLMVVSFQHATNELNIIRPKLESEIIDRFDKIFQNFESEDKTQYLLFFI